jgi:heme-degrading monooxygenase HmoA
MIERQWKGTAHPSEADRYIAHLLGDTLPKLKKIPGFVKASILRRTTAEGVEFQVVTVWKSLEAVKGFAGEGYDEAVVPEAVREMMVEYDETVVHYEIVHEV